MISGTDITLPVSPDRDTIANCLIAIQNSWPNAVVVSPECDAVPAAIADFAANGNDELFIYRDTLAAEAWKRDGGTPELSDSMIHLLPDDEEITLVVGDPGQPESAAILNGISEALGRAELPKSASDSRRAG